MKTKSLVKYLGMVLSLSMLITVSTAQAGERKVWIRFAGALLQNIEQTEVTVGDSAVPATKSAALVRAWGNLGLADGTVLTLEVETLPPAPNDPACPEGFFKVLDIVENNIVLTFVDLSLLYGEGSGAICADFGTGEVVTVIDGEWTGGTQRFRDASGDWSISFDEAVTVGNAASVLAESGMIRGTLVR